MRLTVGHQNTARSGFVAMGCHAEILVVGGPAALDGADGLAARGRDLVESLERLWTRFQSDSDVSRLNTHAGRGPVRVDSRTIEAVVRAIEGWRVTNGSYDPTVHHALVAHGYDRTFREIDRPLGRPTEATPASYSACSTIHVDELAQTIELPPDVGIDLGGIGKGFAGDLLADELLALGAAGVMVNIGGDVRVAGDAPEAEWVVAIDEPAPGCRVPNLRLRSGAVAVSSTQWRRWALGDRDVHHIIDPRTMKPTGAQNVGAVVVAGRGWWAEVLAKALLVDGGSAVLRYLEPTSPSSDTGIAHGLVVDSSGTITQSSGFADFGTPSPATEVHV